MAQNNGIPGSADTNNFAQPLLEQDNRIGTVAGNEKKQNHLSMDL